MSGGDGAELVPKGSGVPAAQDVAGATAPAAAPAGSGTSARPVARDRLASERVIINAPMSFAGAAQRAFRIGGNSKGIARAVIVALVVIPVLLIWWTFVLLWYLVFGLWLVPYRLLRRGARKRKAEALRHREMLGAMDAMRRE